MSNVSTTVFRVSKGKDNPYVILNKEFLSNENLSWKAKGLLTYLLSKPDDWRIMMSDLIKKSTDGRDAVYSAIKELISAGYIVRNSYRKNGRYSGLEHIVYEKPTVTTDQPLPENQETDIQETDNPPLLNNDNNNKLKTLNNNQSVSHTYRDIQEPTDRPTDDLSDEVDLEELFTHARLDMFDKKFQDLVRLTVEDMYYSDSFAKNNRIPHSVVRARLTRLDIDILHEVLAQKESVALDPDIKNWNGYFKKLLYNAILDGKRWS